MAERLAWAGDAGGVALLLPWWLRLRALVGGVHCASRPEVAADPEPAVVERARRGDPDAFGELVRHHDSRLRALAYRLKGDASRTDDVLQEAYVKAFRSLPKFRGDSALGTWLYRITYNWSPTTSGQRATMRTPPSASCWRSGSRWPGRSTRPRAPGRRGA